MSIKNKVFTVVSVLIAGLYFYGCDTAYGQTKPAVPNVQPAAPNVQPAVPHSPTRNIHKTRATPLEDDPWRHGPAATSPPAPAPTQTGATTPVAPKPAPKPNPAPRPKPKPKPKQT